MIVQIQSVHFDADSKLIEHVNKKLEKLSIFNGSITAVDVYLVLDNVAHHIKDKVAEIKVHIPRHSFFVKHSSKAFEESFDAAFDSMVTRLKRQKEKMIA